LAGVLNSVADLLATYDRQLRRDARARPPGRVEQVGPVVRYLSDIDDSWEAVIWADIDESTADAEIARQVEFFADRGRRFEWKHHAYDTPADLAARLIAAGFKREDDEAIMVAETASIAADVALPSSIRLAPVVDAAGVDLVMQVHHEVFGTDDSWLREDMLSGLRAGQGSPTETDGGVMAIVAMAGDQPVCSARIEFHEGTDFASLWGGGTLPEWRGRGIYRALVSYRAGLAAGRHYRYLQVDASPDSQPILERLGFVRLTTTTPYVWQPRTSAPR